MDEKENGKNRKKGSMKKAFIISLILSLVITITYLGIETFCVKTGRDMPYQKVDYGGECIEYSGVFWGVTLLAPLTNKDEPSAPSPIITYFSWIRLLLVFLTLAFLIWCVLCVFHRRIKPVLIVIGSIVAVVLVVIGCKRLKKAWDDAPVEISSIMVITSDIHQENYFSLRYPYDASYLVRPGDEGEYGKTAYTHMGQCMEPQTVTGKQLKALLKAAQSVKEASDTDKKKDFMYYIKVVYKTHEGYGNVQTYGYGAFPEEWATFVRLTNEICGQEYLREQPEPVILTAEWFSETYGFYDKDLPEGASVEHFLSTQKIPMKYICGIDSSGNYRHYDPTSAIKNYLSLFE